MRLLSMILVVAVLLSALSACSPHSRENGSDIAPTTTGRETEETSPPEADVLPQICVSTFEELESVSLDTELEAGTVVRIVNDIEISSELRFTLPLFLSVEAEVTCMTPIVFDTNDSGKIEISVMPDVKTDKLDLLFDAPGCDLIWQNGAPYANGESAALDMNVKTYNGIDVNGEYGLGGECLKKIISFSVTSEENELLDSSIEWSVRGNTVYTAVSYLLDANVLKQANVRIELDDGSIVNEPIDLISGQTFTVTDEKGGSRVYRIITDRITYNLPVFYIEIDGGEEVSSREEYLRAAVRVDTSSAIGDFPELETTAVNIRGRGHYTWNFDKTPYKLKFDSKTSVLGMSAAKDWVLLANYVDRSLIQNYVAMEMGKIMDNIPYHSTQYPVDVFVNGTYRGVYTFGEQLEVKKDRIDLSENGGEADTDYLLEIGGIDEGDVEGRDFFHSSVTKYVKIKHPESSGLSQDQLDYLIGYVNEADLAVRTLTGYEDYIDIDSLIDWVIIHELTYNLDCCFRRSCYLIKEKGGKLKMGPIWDFDLAFGNFYRYKTDDWATVGTEDGYVFITWMNYLMEDEDFVKRLTDRWNEIKEPLLKNALDSVDHMSELVAPSADMNFKVWDILGKKIPSQSNSQNKYDTYEKMIGRLKDFLINRYAWIDGQLN